MQTTSLAASSGLAALFLATAALAEPTTYPLTIQNCGQEVTFVKAPERTGVDKTWGSSSVAWPVLR